MTNDQCKGITAKGQQCSRGATTGQYCRSHAASEPEAKPPSEPDTVVEYNDDGTARQQCKGTTKAGSRCRRKAYKGDAYCALHQQDQKPPPPSARSGARATRKKPLREQFSFSYENLLKRCRKEGKDPSDNSTLVQWAQMELKVIIAAKEEQRLLEGLGAGTQHNINIIVPTDKPRMPVDAAEEQPRDDTAATKPDERLLN